MPRRLLSEHDRQVWASYVRHLVPMPGVASPTETAVGPPPKPPPQSRVEPFAPQLAKRSAPLEIGAAPGGVDRSTWTKFRSGKLSPARTLDLHGMTAQRAYTELQAFLTAAVAQRLRCVEIITGRGRGESGVIRRETPLWLNGPTLRPMVLAATHPHPANPGAVRLLLRRVR